jgi:hypothetical protein
MAIVLFCLEIDFLLRVDYYGLIISGWLLRVGYYWLTYVRDKNLAKAQ